MHADTATCMHAVHSNLPVLAESMHTHFDNLMKCTRNHCAAAKQIQLLHVHVAACYCSLFYLELLYVLLRTLMSHAPLICTYICVYLYIYNTNRIWNVVII
jgi:heme O synthase-like polyprenyltransferase